MDWKIVRSHPFLGAAAMGALIASAILSPRVDALGPLASPRAPLAAFVPDSPFPLLRLTPWWSLRGTPLTGWRREIPVPLNPWVERSLRELQEAGTGQLSRWLARSGRYLPLMERIFRRQGLPPDLAYLTLVESGCDPEAISPAMAAGPWQLMATTARRYGLQVNEWVDERRDPEKSTRAAATYLRDLYSLFGTWDLALAAYNAGEGRVLSALHRTGESDYWGLAARGYLLGETETLVSRFLSVLLLTKDPHLYDLVDVNYWDPIRYDTVRVPPLTPLATVACVCGTSISELRRLNPALLQDATPPGSARYALHVPKGAALALGQALAGEADASAAGA